jgi:hypothetical protein
MPPSPNLGEDSKLPKHVTDVGESSNPSIEDESNHQDTKNTKRINHEDTRIMQSPPVFFVEGFVSSW